MRRDGVVYYGFMDTLDSLTISQARLALDKARATLAAAEKAARDAADDVDVLETFTLVCKVYAVMAREPEYAQFVSYSLDGRLAATFNSLDEAERYRDSVKPPAGYVFMVEQIELFA